MDYGKIIELIYDARKIAKDAALRAEVSEKSEDDFVTAVDFAISDFVKAGLAKIAPGVAFVTEEEDEHVECGERFILDPIDGTTNLTRGGRQVSISLGYYVGGHVELGVVFNPFYDEMFFAVRGRGAHYYDARDGIRELLTVGVENYTEGKMSVADKTPDRAIVEFGANVSNKALADKNFAIAKRVFNDCLDIRRNCSSALAICYIADGRIDGYFERRLKVWDYCAASLILEEAGGRLSQWSGEPLTYTTPATIVAGAPETYTYLRGILGEEGV